MTAVHEGIEAVHLHARPVYGGATVVAPTLAMKKVSWGVSVTGDALRIAADVTAVRRLAP